METIILKIKNKKKLDHFLAFIKDLDFVEVLQDSQTSKQEVKRVEKAKSDDFFALAGIWENRDIDADDLSGKLSTAICRNSKRISIEYRKLKTKRVKNCNWEK